MTYKVISRSSGNNITLRDYPGVCPECHVSTTPNYNSAAFSKDKQKLYAFLTCPNPQCDKSYVAEYNIFGIAADFHKIVIGSPKAETFPDEIMNLSSSFVRIYNEALVAEQLGLSEISGVGFRKALEFLIKDYLIQLNPDDEGKIKNMLLGKCISELVEDHRLKESAKRAVWLGNDHTHYIKKWENKDLFDLKRLIKLTVNWVESEILTRQLSDEMPE